MTGTRRLGLFVLAASLAASLGVMAACGSAGSDPTADDPETTTATTPAPVTTPTPVTAAVDTQAPPSTSAVDEAAGVEPAGFTTVLATITDPEGEECEVCLWLADSPDERGRGLMGVTDLGAAVGMAFVFEQPTSGAFYMFQTPTPLSIAWFAPGGAWVGATDMEPCTDKPANECELYGPGAEYDVAIETFAGGLGELGLVDGATVVLIPGSEAPECLTRASLSDP